MKTDIIRCGRSLFFSFFALWLGFPLLAQTAEPLLHQPIPGGLQGKTCLDCHIEGELKKESVFSKYSLEKAFETYFLTSHGKAWLLKDERAPYCHTCHESSSWNDILPVSNPKSKMHPDNIHKVCAQCHGEGILTARIVEGSMHFPFNRRTMIVPDDELVKAGFLSDKTKREEAYFVGNVDIVILTYKAFFLLFSIVMSVMILYVILDFIKKLKTREEFMELQLKDNGEKVRRFSKGFLIQHIILFSSVFVAIITGIPMRYADQPWAQQVVAMTGGNEIRHQLHIIAGFVMVILGVLHLLQFVVFHWNPPFWKHAMFPRLQDIKDFFSHNLYNLGLREKMPPMGRYTWYEKLDYIGATWGIAVMGITGLAMFFMDTILNWVSLAVLQMAWLAHAEEAMLATMFLLIVHMYHAHFNPRKFPGSKTWIDGKISKTEKDHEHPLEK